MARMHHNISYSDTKAEKCEYKDVRRGASEDAFWDEDELVDHRRSAVKKKKPRRGCPENDYKAHVYIWQEVVKTYRYTWSGRLYTSRYKEKICCGCLHVTTRIYDWNRNYGNY